MLLLNPTPASTETLKNLILPAIGSFTVVDNCKVTERDLGNNFFVTPESLGHSRAQVTSELLKELNPDVQGDFIEDSVENVVFNRLTQGDELIKKYQLIVAADVDNVSLATRKVES
jgi:amyloid beta precursor protein binding protein 1